MGAGRLLFHAGLRVRVVFCTIPPCLVPNHGVLRPSHLVLLSVADASSCIVFFSFFFFLGDLTATALSRFDSSSPLLLYERALLGSNHCVFDRLKFRASDVSFAPAPAAGVAVVFAASAIAAFVFLFSAVCRRCLFSKDGRGAQYVEAVCGHFLSYLFSFISFVCSFLSSTTIDSLLVFGSD